MALGIDVVLGNYDGELRRPSQTLALSDVLKTVQGLVHNYGGLLGVRWMLGMFEAGLFPGVNYYLSWCANPPCSTST
jgi:hypothetical protein